MSLCVCEAILQRPLLSIQCETVFRNECGVRQVASGARARRGSIEGSVCWVVPRT